MLALRVFALLIILSVSASAHAQGHACVSAHEAAQRARRSGQFLEAQRQLLQCAQADCPRFVRSDCTTWAGEVAASTPSLVLAVRGNRGEDLSAVRVFANGALIAEQLDGRALEVDPGVYKLRFEADGYTPREESINVREGEKMRFVRVQLQQPVAPVVAAPVPASAPAVVERETKWSPAAITLGSVALASGAAALGVGLWGKSEYDHVRDECGRAQRCSEADVNPGQRAYIAADVLAGVAAVSALAAVWVFVHDNRERATQVSALPSRDGLRVALSHAF